MQLRNQGQGGTGGYAMAALLVAIAVMGVMLSVVMPTWRQMAQREKEEELIFRGQQYVRAIGLFQRRYAASFPPDVDTLVTQKFLRKKYEDPMTPDGEFQVLYQMSVLPGQGQGGRGGTASGSTSRGGTASGGTASGRGSPATVGQGQPGAAAGGASSGGRGGTAFGFSGGGTLGPRGGMIGVASKSTDTSLRLYNGRNHYNEWQFIFAPTLMPGQGMGRPGMPGRGGRGVGQPGFGPGGRGGTGPGGRGMGPGGFGQPGQQRPGGRGPG